MRFSLRQILHSNDRYCCRYTTHQSSSDKVMELMRKGTAWTLLHTVTLDTFLYGRLQQSQRVVPKRIHPHLWENLDMDVSLKFTKRARQWKGNKLRENIKLDVLASLSCLVLFFKKSRLLLIETNYSYLLLLPGH